MTSDEFRENRRVSGGARWGLIYVNSILYYYVCYEKRIGRGKILVWLLGDCSRCRSHRVYTIHVARTRYYIIITKVYSIYIYIYICVFYYIRAAEKWILLKPGVRHSCAAASTATYTPQFRKNKKGCTHNILHVHASIALKYNNMYRERPLGTDCR